jgi:hypothetical protein
MAPSLEHYEEATSGIPVKVLGTQIDGTNGAATLQLEEADKHDQVLRVFRCLIADLCEQFKGGHPGGKLLLQPLTLQNRTDSNQQVPWEWQPLVCHFGNMP